MDAAERFGWNADPTVPGEVPSTLPPATEIKSPLEVGVHRDRPVPHAGHAAACWPRWRRRSPRAACAPVPTLALGERTERVRVTSRRVARTIGSTDGRRGGLRDRHRGGAARASRWRARPAPRSSRTRATRRRARPQPPDPSNTDAWFTAYAPARAPGDRGGGDAGARRSGRRHGGAGRARGARGGAARLGTLDVELERARFSPPSAASISSSSGRFSVISSGQLEQQHRSRRGPELGDAAGLGDALLGGEPCAVSRRTGCPPAARRARTRSPGCRGSRSCRRSPPRCPSGLQTWRNTP